ncbi:hypothetical protein ACP70R_020698 [Stipagrostis hirtigluma subsp. patula]
MEVVLSAAASDLISRIISFLLKRYIENTAIDEKLQRLQQLLLRIHAVVEEADGRYITNPRMLVQLKVLVAHMYKGYHMLDMLRYKSDLESTTHEDSTMSSIHLKRSRTFNLGTIKSFAESNDLQSILESMENAIANMTEFVVLLGGCERQCRRPYDTYLYIDKFLFGRHVEKQQIINTLLQNHGHHGTPVVLPIIGGIRVGKKALVSHVCENDRIRSYFSSILFVDGDSICRMDQEMFSNERILIVVEFITDVDDDDWVKFYSTVRCMAAEGSKVIIISRIQNLARFGTVKAVFLNGLSHEEYRYLFKVLAFGSTDEKDNPHLASVANELAIVLRGSLITANVVADLLRRNHDFQFWLRILRRFKGMVDSNVSMYGEHPKHMLENEQAIDITTFNPSCRSSLRLMPPQVEREDSPKQKLAHVSFGDLISGCVSIPADQFVLVAWESRIPPYTRLVANVTFAAEKHECSTSTRKRRCSI